MARKDVGIGEYRVSRDLEEEIKTYALGSCVALVVWDNDTKVGGLIHIALPESKINPEKALDRPGYFVDSGLPLFFNELKKLGGNRKASYIKLIGGSSILDESNTFDIGRRNTLAVKKYLWKVGLPLTSEDVGGSISRTVALKIQDGSLVISNGTNKWTI